MKCGAVLHVLQLLKNTNEGHGDAPTLLKYHFKIIEQKKKESKKSKLNNHQ